jgi:hypothetical protein
MTMTGVLDRFLFALGVAATGTVAYGIAGLLMSDAFGWFVLPAIVGGTALAAVMYAVNRRQPAPRLARDPFTGMTDVLNMAQVRVAGVGGVGLVAFCAVVTWHYQLISAAMVAGLVGGAAGAWVMVHRRARQQTLGR